MSDSEQVANTVDAHAGRKRRYSAVSDGYEWTVWDDLHRRDLFPTKTTNRTWACKLGCPESTAQMIADALNFHELERDDLIERNAALSAENYELREQLKAANHNITGAHNG